MEKQRINGTVEKRSDKTGTNDKGRWVKIGLKVNGQWYSTFKETIAKEGDLVSFDAVESNGFWNITGEVAISTPSEGKPASTVTQLPEPISIEEAVENWFAIFKQVLEHYKAYEHVVALSPTDLKEITTTISIGLGKDGRVRKFSKSTGGWV